MAEWTGLQIAQEFCKIRGLPQPSTLTGATDDTTIQIWGLLNDGVRDMCSRFQLQALQYQVVFNHAGGGPSSPYMAYDFGANTPGFKFYIQRTLWDITDRLEVAGPLTPKEWMVLTTMLIASSRYQYAMNQNQFWIFPIPNPLNSINFAFFYQSRYGVWDPTLSGGSGAANDIFSSDSAYPLVNRELIIADLTWRWGMQKGLPYAEDQRKFEEMILNYVGDDPASSLVLDGPEYNPQGLGPLVLIPAGNWPL